MSDFNIPSERANYANYEKIAESVNAKATSSGKMGEARDVKVINSGKTDDNTVLSILKAFLNLSFEAKVASKDTFTATLKNVKNSENFSKVDKVLASICLLILKTRSDLTGQATRAGAFKEKMVNYDVKLKEIKEIKSGLITDITKLKDKLTIIEKLSIQLDEKIESESGSKVEQNKVAKLKKDLTAEKDKTIEELTFKIKDLGKINTALQYINKKGIDESVVKFMESRTSYLVLKELNAMLPTPDVDAFDRKPVSQSLPQGGSTVLKDLNKVDVSSRIHEGKSGEVKISDERVNMQDLNNEARLKEAEMDISSFAFPAASGSLKEQTQWLESRLNALVNDYSKSELREIKDGVQELYRLQEGETLPEDIDLFVKYLSDELHQFEGKLALDLDTLRSRLEALEKEVNASEGEIGSHIDEAVLREIDRLMIDEGYSIEDLNMDDLIKEIQHEREDAIIRSRLEEIIANAPEATDEEVLRELQSQMDADLLKDVDMEELVSELQEERNDAILKELDSLSVDDNVAPEADEAGSDEISSSEEEFKVELSPEHEAALRELEGLMSDDHVVGDVGAAKARSDGEIQDKIKGLKARLDDIVTNIDPEAYFEIENELSTIKDNLKGADLDSVHKALEDIEFAIENLENQS